MTLLLEFSPHAAPEEGPLNLAVTAQNASTVFASWEPPPLESQNGAILRYTVNIVRTTNSQDVRVQSTSNTNLLTRSLHPFYTYEYRVAAENDVGRSPFTTVTFQMPEACESPWPCRIF